VEAARVTEGAFGSESDAGVSNNASTASPTATSGLATMRPESATRAAPLVSHGRSSAMTTKESIVHVSTTHCDGLSGMSNTCPGSSAKEAGGNRKVTLSRLTHARASTC